MSEFSRGFSYAYAKPDLDSILSKLLIDFCDNLDADIKGLGLSDREVSSALADTDLQGAWEEYINA